MNPTRQQMQNFIERWGYVLHLMEIFRINPNLDEMKLFLDGGIEPPTRVMWKEVWENATEDNWIDLLVAREEALHEARGTNWKRELFVETLKEHGFDLVQKWECVFLLRFTALPIIDMRSPEAQAFDWWAVKPCDWFYETVARDAVGYFTDGRFVPDTEGVFKFRGEIVLIDTRPKNHEWPEDELFCGKIIRRLRKEGKIAPTKEGAKDSVRYFVTIGEWEESVRPAVANLLGVSKDAVRLERGIESNVLPQHLKDTLRINDENSGKQTWCEEWCLDKEGSIRKITAGNYYAEQRVGVISSLRELTSEYHSSSPHPAVRPLVVLAR